MLFAGIDYGLARTGIAVSDPDGRLAFPLATVRFDDHPDRKAFLAAIVEKIRDAGAQGVVMGLPLMGDGSESMTTRQVRNVTGRLKRRLDLPFWYMNEFLTSEAAWADLRESGRKRDKRRAVLDQQAAVRILASFLEQDEERRVPA